MEVTKVEIKSYQKGSMLAFVNLEFDSCMTIKGWKLFKGREGAEYDLGYPSEADKKGAKDDDGRLKYWNFVFIDTKNGETGKKLLGHIKDRVIEAYEGSGTNSSPGPQGNNWPSNDDEDIPF